MASEQQQQAPVTGRKRRGELDALQDDLKSWAPAAGNQPSTQVSEGRGANKLVILACNSRAPLSTATLQLPFQQPREGNGGDRRSVI